jgi:hypothetical protein
MSDELLNLTCPIRADELAWLVGMQAATPKAHRVARRLAFQFDYLRARLAAAEAERDSLRAALRLCENTLAESQWGATLGSGQSVIPVEKRNAALLAAATALARRTAAQ